MQRISTDLLWASLLLLAAAAACPGQSDSTLWRGGRIHVRPGVVLEGADVLVQKDAIKSVGVGLTAPDGAAIVDLAGEDVYPGFIDPLNDGLLEPSYAGRGSFGGSDATLDAFDPFRAIHNRELLRSGVLTVGLGGVPSGIRGGVVSVIAVAETVGEPDVVAKNQFVPTEISALERIGRAGAPRGFDPFGAAPSLVPTTSVMMRDASAKAVDETLDGAKRYREAWEKYEKDFTEYEKKLAEWEKTKPADSRPASRPATDPPERRSGGGARSGPPPEFREWPREKQREWMRENMGGGRRAATESTESESAASASTGSGKPKAPEKPRVDHGKAALVRVLKRETPLWIVAHWASDIDAALDIAKTRNVRVVLAGASEAPRRLEAIKDARIVVALGSPLLTDPDNFDRMLQRDDAAALLVKAGIPVTFFTAGDAWLGPQGLPACAALAIGAGLSEDAALAAVTVYAARSVGLEKKLGTIEAGKLATMFTCRGSPFAPGAAATRVMQRGKAVDVRGAAK